MIFLAGPGHGGPAIIANVYLEGTYSEIYPEVSPDQRGPPPAVPPVLDARRRAEPRQRADAGVDSRGRRAGLRARPRLRRGLRQPGSDRRRGGGRRRGGDRAARRLVEGRQLPEPRPRRRRAPDPAPQRLQDRRADGAGPLQPTKTCARSSRGTATTCTSSRATIRWRCTSSSRRRWTRCYRRDPRHPAGGAQRRASRGGRAGRRSCCARPRAGPGRRRWTACPSRARSASHQVPLPRS